jgi:hypothetical protein
VKRFILIFLTFAVVSISASTADEIARVARTVTTSTSSWAVVAVEQNQSPTFAPIILTWSVSGGFAYDYFTFRNIGGVIANNFAVAIAQRRVSGNAPANEIVFERCVGGTWNITSNVCSGSVSQVGSATNSSIHFSSIALAPGNELAMRARTTINNRNQFEITLSVQLSRSDVRAKQVVHS